MEAKKTIRITKSRIYRRRFVDGIKRLFSKLVDFVWQLFGKRRPVFPHSGSQLEPIRIKSAIGNNGSEVRDSRLLSSPPSGSIQPETGDTIRIRPRSREREAGNVLEQIAPVATPPLVPVQRRALPRKRRKRSIKITTGLQVCPACRQPLLSEDSKAKCRANPEHLIHHSCIKLMKGKCPNCGGALV